MRKTIMASIFIAALLLGTLVLSGCVASDESGSQSTWKGRGSGNRTFDRGNFGNRTFGNLTEKQRQDFFEKRLQEALKACEGKAEKDACTLQTIRGSFDATCKTQNGTLLCIPLMAGNRTFSRTTGRGFGGSGGPSS